MNRMVVIASNFWYGRTWLGNRWRWIVEIPWFHPFRRHGIIWRKHCFFAKPMLETYHIIAYQWKSTIFKISSTVNILNYDFLRHGPYVPCHPIIFNLPGALASRKKRAAQHYEKAIQMASTDGPGRMGTKGNTHLLGPILSHQDAKVYIDVFWKTTSNWKSFVGGGFNSFKFHSYLGRWSNLTSIVFNWVETTN